MLFNKREYPDCVKLTETWAQLFDENFAPDQNLIALPRPDIDISTDAISILYSHLHTKGPSQNTHIIETDSQKWREICAELSDDLTVASLIAQIDQDTNSLLQGDFRPEIRLECALFEPPVQSPHIDGHPDGGKTGQILINYTLPCTQFWHPEDVDLIETIHPSATALDVVLRTGATTFEMPSQTILRIAVYEDYIRSNKTIHPAAHQGRYSSQPRALLVGTQYPSCLDML